MNSLFKFVSLFIAVNISLSNANFVDLTHVVDENTIYWPTGSPFNFTSKVAADTEQGFFYSANEFQTPEHLGTHLDAPYHFCRDCITIDQIPIENFIANGFLIDISEKCKKNPNYLLSVEDLKFSKEDLESLKGKRNFLVIRTGWSKYWNDKLKYMGTADNDVSKLSFPGISEEAAKHVVNMKLFVGLGLDTASTDYGQSKDFKTHQVLSKAGLFAIENMANLDQLPSKDFYLFIFPMKIKGGTGGPVRVTAFVDGNRFDKFTEL